MGKNWKADNIDALTEDQAKKMALESMVIKAHNIYLVDFEGYFGYSCLVFKNNHHIYYADDFELHHRYLVKTEGRKALRLRYIEYMNNKLFTEDEICGPIKDYDDYTAKSYYLHNYYGMQMERVSIFGGEEKKKIFEKAKKTGVYNPVAFCYMQDRDFVKHHIELNTQLEERRKEMDDDYEYLKKAFIKEMYNHEYSINWQADYDTLSAFGSVEYHDNLNAYFEDLKFSDIQKKAYLDARREYYKQIDEVA